MMMTELCALFKLCDAAAATTGADTTAGAAAEVDDVACRACACVSQLCLYFERV
jgi:hypothetical protein